MSKSRVLLSSLTTLGLLGAGIVGATTMNVGGDKSNENWSFLDVKAEDNVSFTNDVKSNDTNIIGLAEYSTMNNVDGNLGFNFGSDLFLNVKTELPPVEIYTESSESDIESDIVENIVDDIPDLNVETIVDNQIDEDSMIVDVESDSSNVANESLNVLEEQSDNDYEFESHIDQTEEEDVLNETFDIDVNPELVNHISESNADVLEENQVLEETIESLENESEVIIEEFVESLSSDDLDVQKVEDVSLVIDENIESVTLETEIVPTNADTVIENDNTYLSNPTPDYSNNTYPIGQCTWGVKSLAPWVGNYWGNANQWGSSAQNAGFSTGLEPMVGSVIVFPNSMYEGFNYGHVAYVTAVYDDGTIEILESNYAGNQTIGNYRGRFNPNSEWWGGGVYYIYPNV